MKEVRTMQFVDAESKQDALTVVRVGKGVVGLSVSIADAGDVEVFLTLDDCRSLVAAIAEALQLASTL